MLINLTTLLLSLYIIDINSIFSITIITTTIIAL